MPMRAAAAMLVSLLATVAAIPSAGAVTPDDLVGMLRRHVPESEIIAAVTRERSVIELSDAQWTQLRKAGASDRLLDFLSSTRERFGHQATDVPQVVAPAPVPDPAKPTPAAPAPATVTDPGTRAMLAVLVEQLRAEEQDIYGRRTASLTLGLTGGALCVVGAALVIKGAVVLGEEEDAFDECLKGTSRGCVQPDDGGWRAGGWSVLAMGFTAVVASLALHPFGRDEDAVRARRIRYEELLSLALEQQGARLAYQGRF